MEWFLFLVLLIIAIAVFVKKASLNGGLEGAPKTRYQFGAPLFTPAERSFLGVLDQAVGDIFRIFGKVRVADVLQPARGLDRGERQSALNKITSKHFDYVLCESGDLSVVGVVELDDKSHNQSSRKERDRFLEDACTQAGLPLLRFNAKQSYSISEIRGTVMLALGRSELVEIEAKPSDQSIDATGVEERCPRCSSELVVRVAKKGENAGREFLACSTFPICRYAKHKTVVSSVATESV